MPCCHWILSAAVSAASSRSTPSWLHRLHAKGGLSFPSHLHIDDLLYGQPPPPPSSSSNQQQAVAQEPPLKPKHPKPKQQQHTPRSNNSSGPNPSSPQPPLSVVISDVFAIPSDLPPPSPLKAFRKQSRPRPRPDKYSPPPHNDNKDKKAKKDKAKARKRRRAERAADADGQRSTVTEVTVIDTSTDGWKAAKLLVRKGAVWKVRDKEAPEVSQPEEDLNKGKRRAGLVSKIQRDKEKEKEAALQGNIHASSGDVVKESDDPIQTLKRLRCSEPVPEGQSAGILHLQTTNRVKKNGLACPKGDSKGK